MPDSKVEFLFLSQPEMIQAGVLDMAACVDTMDEAFAIMGTGDYLMGGPDHHHHGMMIHFPEEARGPRMPVKGPDRRFMAMVSYLGGDYHLCGTKWYGSNAENPKRGLPRSILLVIINDPDTGAPIAIMDGNLISAMRTGAAVGLGARYLAPKNGSVAGVVAAGPISRTCLMAIKAGMPGLTEARVYDLDEAKTKAFCQEMSEELGIDAHPVGSMAEAVIGCDAISTAASGSVVPHFKKEWFKPGAFFGISSEAAMDEELWFKGRLVADNWKMHTAWRDEVKAHNPEGKMVIHDGLHELIGQGRIKDSDVVEMGEVVAGRQPGRVDEDQPIIYLTGGLGMEDVSWGYRVYERAKQMGLGTPLKLWDKPLWF